MAVEAGHLCPASCNHIGVAGRSRQEAGRGEDAGEGRGRGERERENLYIINKTAMLPIWALLSVN